MSLPLPRPVDFATSWPEQLNIINNVTHHGRTKGYIPWKSYKPFLEKQRHHETQRIKDVNDYTRDGLHLSDAGTRNCGNK